MESKVTQGLGSTTASSSGSKASMPVKAKTLSKSEISSAVSYNKKNNQSICKKIQNLVGATPDNAFGPKTVQAIANWQATKGLDPDGKFGPQSAAKAGITIPAPSASAPEYIPAGGGINPQPGFDKQYNYKTSPYVSKAHYNEMKKAMGDVAYSKWNINDKKISGIYAKAKKANSGDNTTISSSGCGVTAYANLKKISPKTSAEMAMKGGYRAYNSGTARGFFTSNGGSEASSASSALKSVANGKYAICSMNNANGNYWTKGGHFILVYGYDGTYVYVSDSASSADKRAKAKKKYFTDAFKYGFLF